MYLIQRLTLQFVKPVYIVKDRNCQPLMLGVEVNKTQNTKPRGAWNHEHVTLLKPDTK